MGSTLQPRWWPIAAATTRRPFGTDGDWHTFIVTGHLARIIAPARGTDTPWVDEYVVDVKDRESG